MSDGVSTGIAYNGMQLKICLCIWICGRNLEPCTLIKKYIIIKNHQEEEALTHKAGEAIFFLYLLIIQ